MLTDTLRASGTATKVNTTNSDGHTHSPEMACTHRGRRRLKQRRHITLFITSLTPGKYHNTMSERKAHRPSLPPSLTQLAQTHSWTHVFVFVNKLPCFHAKQLHTQTLSPRQSNIPVGVRPWWRKCKENEWRESKGGEKTHREQGQEQGEWGQADEQYLFLLQRKEDRGSHASLETDKDPAGERQCRAGRHTHRVWGETRGQHTHTPTQRNTHRHKETHTQSVKCEGQCCTCFFCVLYMGDYQGVVFWLYTHIVRDYLSLYIHCGQCCTKSWPGSRHLKSTPLI